MSLVDGPRESGRSGREISMSLIVVSPGNFANIRLTVSYLAEQTIRDSLELVIVAPSKEELGLIDSEVASFHSVQVIEAGEIIFRGKASAAGVRAAKGPILAMVENHVFPAPTWAEALVAAHEGPWAGICPQVDIFNPKTAYSRAERFIDYGNWIAHDDAGEIDHLPWHNSSFKRDLLMQYSSELESLLEPEEHLQNRLRGAGHRFYIEPRARILHVSDSSARNAHKAMFLRGRGFAAERSQDWSLVRRLLYVFASPLFPLARLVYLRANYRRFSRRHPVVPLIPAIFALLVTIAVGECAGYLFGEGDPENWLARHEFDLGLRANRNEMREIERLLRQRIGKHGAQA